MPGPVSRTVTATCCPSAFARTVTLPPGSTFLFARGGEVWVRQQGEYDEHYLVRYGVEWELNRGSFPPTTSLDELEV